MTGNGGRRPPLVADRRYQPSTRDAKSRSTRQTGTGGGSGGGQGGGQGGGRRGGPPKTPKRAPRRRRNPIAALVVAIVGGIWRTVFTLGATVAVAGALVLGAAVLHFYSQLPPVEKLLDARTRGSVTMLDDNAQVFAWRGETFGGEITAKTVSPYLKNAIVATEDRRFYQHLGISPRGIASAIKINLSEGRGALSGNGGSTITQQVAKLLCLGVEYDPAEWKNEASYEADCRVGSVWRKLKEVPYAFAMEAKYGKDNILTIYLNRAYLGAGTRGFEAASQRYFGKSAANVTPAEAAMLAGLLKAPSRYAPTANLERSQERASLIIGLMEEQGYLTRAEADEARAHPAELSDSARQETGGYFADWVMESGPDFLTRDTTEDVVIRTTFDQRIQAAAEGAVHDVFESKLKSGSKAQAAVVVMSADGAVRAMVGGTKTGVQGAFNRATMARRQTGSTFKPFVYAAALDENYPPSSIVQDAPLTINVPGSGPWSPQNYEKGVYRGPITMMTALANSVNTSTIRVQEAVGRENVRRIAEGFGFAHDLADGPALALGVSESTLIEMTGAYAGFLNGGSSVRPYGIESLSLKNESEPLMGKDGGMGERVISETAARQLVYMMTRVIKEGSGRRADLGDRPAAGKTGTTQAARDAWFIGFTADYVAGVWMGYDDNTPLSGVTGGGLPAEIWHEVMTRVEKGLPIRDLPMDAPTEFYGQVPANQGGTGPVPGQPDFPYQGETSSAESGNVAERVLNDVLGAILGRR
ncbi:transglycosylase domain-containing protein [Frigidibacter sp. MR17.24]|uniref:transglycosylase domain-containing protein n=1 Tax=Frigidibacter sp. MR17.24 TaxID=3127345 RepID=UPI003012AD9D